MHAAGPIQAADWPGVQLDPEELAPHEARKVTNAAAIQKRGAILIAVDV
jgi:hypothetical protein